MDPSEGLECLVDELLALVLQMIVSPTFNPVGVLGTGVPRLACLRRGSSGGPVRPIFINANSRPSRGAKPRGRMTQGFSGAASPGRLARRQRGQGKGTSQGARDATHDDQDHAGARRAPASAVSSFPLWCKGGKRRRGVPRHQAKVSISVQQDQDQ